MPSKLPKNFLCLDCKVSTWDEYYMVHDELWKSAVPNKKGMLCINCLETRIQRELTKKDFNEARVNWNPGWEQSETLLKRLAN